MNGIEKITAKIITDAREAAAALVENAREKALAISRDYAEKAAAIKEELDGRTAAEADAIVSRARQSVETIQRNAILAEQAAILDEVFVEAYNSIRGLPDDKYVSFLAMLSASALAEQTESQEENLRLYGPDEESEAVESYEILLCKSDRDKYSELLLEEIRHSVIGRIPPEVVERLVISKETANIDGGIILRYGSIESNCSLALMFERIRANLEGRVAKLLFTIEE